MDASLGNTSIKCKYATMTWAAPQRVVKVSQSGNVDIHHPIFMQAIDQAQGIQQIPSGDYCGGKAIFLESSRSGKKFLQRHTIKLEHNEVVAHAYPPFRFIAHCRTRNLRNPASDCALPFASTCR
jgi:hypothetical protein